MRGSRAGAAARAGAATGKPWIETASGPAVANELILGLAPGASAEEVAGAAGGEVIWRAPRSGYHVVRFTDAGAAAAGLDALRGDPRVVEVARSYIARGTGVGTTPGLMDIQWNLFGLGLDPYRFFGDAFGVSVAILDTGVAYEDHSDGFDTYRLASDLSGVRFASGYDFVNDDLHANDDNGHGTHLAGVVAASSGITSIAGGAEILPVKVLDAGMVGTELALAEGILFAAESGAHVINMSLSFSPNFYPSRLLQRAVAQAARMGVVMVAAVGNDGSVAVTYPAAFRDVIAVAAAELSASFRPSATQVRGLRWQQARRHLAAAAYSNQSFRIDVTVPGGNLAADVDGDGVAEGIVAQSFAGDPSRFDYYLHAGTSPAVAQVSALAALVRARNPGLPPGRVRALLGESTLSGIGRADEVDLAVGLGFADGGWVTRHAAAVPGNRRAEAAVTALVRVSRVAAGSGWRGRATVELRDGTGLPLAATAVYGSFVAGSTSRTGR